MIEAERAFAADAQKLGQWTAFRKWAAADATMFVPQPTNAQAWLRDRQEPAHAVEWWPTASYVSCDGKVAVNTGGWRRADGSVGYFSTVWRREADGDWRWIVDGGDALIAPRPRPLHVPVVRGACQTDRVSYGPVVAGQGNGGAIDGSLTWSWVVRADGSRVFLTAVKQGRRDRLVIENRIAAP